MLGQVASLVTQVEHPIRHLASKVAQTFLLVKDLKPCWYFERGNECFDTDWGRHGRALRHGWAVLTCWRGTVGFGSGTVVLPSTGGPCRFAVRACAQTRVAVLRGFVFGGLEAMAKEGSQ